ncbi:high frequency lysogenization protein HflD [Kitasatospora sp. NPDC002040]|uniref:nickel/cobalt transporter n=1 Tax=Kitasatospora sp. NPDC002040 TaxID=3154661 RepID=UPI0033317981
MTVPRSLLRTAVASSVLAWLLGAAAPVALAHPLGNFSVNHYLGLTVHQDHITATAVTDSAEIPTLQEQSRVDRDGDGTVNDAERAAWAAEGCEHVTSRLRLTVDQAVRPPAWEVLSASFRYEDGTAGLRTSRLECRLSTPLRIASSGTAVEVRTGVDPARVGWNEITARGEMTRLERSDVPESSASSELRDYPRELLDSPKGVTLARFTALPATTRGAAAGAVRADAEGSGPSAWLASLDTRLAELGTAHRLTVPLGLLAVLLSIVLGAGHALLPGHGKTVMAAYLAGRRGRMRDALTVGATVTLTHTAGVLVIGLSLTAFSSLAGDALLGRLGVLSGALVALVGAGLLREALRGGRAPSDVQGRDVVPQDGAVTSVPVQDSSSPRELAHAASPAIQHIGPPLHEHHHGPAHDHRHSQPAEHDHHHDGHPHQHEHRHEHPHHAGHRHGLFGTHHHHDHGSGPKRGNLIGLGIAGGLVPSPSALVVLLGAVALGRTLFGATLVVAYGLGMAATLTAVGLLLVRLGDRISTASGGPVISRLRRLAPYSGLLTALLVLTVGVGLVLRSLPTAL